MAETPENKTLKELTAAQKQTNENLLKINESIKTQMSGVAKAVSEPPKKNTEEVKEKKDVDAKQTAFLEDMAVGIGKTVDSLKTLNANILKGIKEKSKMGLGILIAGIVAPIIVLVNFFKQLALEFKFLKKLTGKGLSKLFSPLKTLFKGKGPLGKLFLSLSKSIKGISASIKGSKAFIGISKIGTSIKNGITTLGKFFKPIGSFFKTIFNISKNLTTLTKTAKGIVKFASKFGSILGKIFLPITFLMGAYDFVTGFMDGYKEGGILGGLEGGLSKLFKTLIGMPLDLLKSAISWILEKFGFDNAKESLDSFSFSDLIGDMISGIFGMIKGAVDWIKLLFTDPVEALSNLWTGLLGTFKTLTDILYWPINKAITWVKGLFSWGDPKEEFSLGSFIFGEPDGIISKVIAWVKGLFSWAKKTGETEEGGWSLVTMIDNVFTNIKTRLDDLVFKAVENIIGWFSKILDIDWGVVLDKLVPNWAKKILGIDSPQKSAPPISDTQSEEFAAIDEKNRKAKEARKNDRGGMDWSNWRAAEKKKYGAVEGQNAADWTKSVGGFKSAKAMFHKYEAGGETSKGKFIVKPLSPIKTGIDWNFISKKEGGSKLEGYVPDPEGSKSGVTIATGFDLGARSLQDIKGLSPELIAKLKPFLGFQGMNASAALKQAGGLKITAKEATEIDKMSKGGAVKKLKNEWNKRAKEIGGKMFGDLSSSQKTIAASVAFQYGSLSKVPTFRKAMQTGDWTGAANELDNFGDSYGTRRKSEATYLRNNSGQLLSQAASQSQPKSTAGGDITINKGGDNNTEQNITTGTSAINSQVSVNKTQVEGASGN
jgi:GH24 family phage-related lysozyme (muramidase)